MRARDGGLESTRRDECFTGISGFTNYSLVLDVTEETSAMGYAIELCGSGHLWVNAPTCSDAVR